MIDSQTLEKFNAQQISLSKNEVLFWEGDSALHYWQVKEGAVKMVNYSDEGQEFTQGIFHDGSSFGEPPLFAGLTYPCNAVAVEKSIVWKLSKNKFLDLLRENFDLHLAFTIRLSERIHYKATIMREISSFSPEHRILTFIDYLKEQQCGDQKHYEVPFTRQQIADMTGLRVETVIRSIKSLAEQGKVSIVNRKVIR